MWVTHKCEIAKKRGELEKKEKKKFARTHKRNQLFVAGCVDCVYAMCVKDRNVRIFYGPSHAAPLPLSLSLTISLSRWHFALRNV